tara:strand:- start:695 stop:889 length:195 start_codon:yes stop_codon:yes gene_type:complete
MSGFFEYILLPLFGGLGLGLVLGVIVGAGWFRNRKPVYERSSSLDRQSVRVRGPGVVRKDEEAS